MTEFPTVERDAASAGFFDASARGELLVQRCTECGAALAPDARTCPDCGSAALEPLPASGDGTLVSWVVVHKAPLPEHAGAVPYLSALVELAEGPWLLVRLVDAEPSALASGVPVRVRFVVAGETLPVFAPVS